VFGAILEVSPCLTLSSTSALLSCVSRINQTWQIGSDFDVLTWIEHVAAKAVGRATPKPSHRSDDCQVAARHMSLWQVTNRIAPRRAGESAAQPLAAAKRKYGVPFSCC
jgi:hypothetical protein